MAGESGPLIALSAAAHTGSRGQDGSQGLPNGSYAETVLHGRFRVPLKPHTVKNFVTDCTNNGSNS